jgi:hypothetical protein
VQIIDIAAATTPGTDGPAASNAALASRVDLINALALGNKANTIGSYFSANVSGGALSGVTATASTSNIDNALTAALTNEINNSIYAGVTAVPEPGVVLGLITGLGFTLLLRRRI